jgi:NADH dehydrogenase
MTPRRPRVIVIGGGFAGLAATRALRRGDAEVLLVDRQNHHVFQPLLYQVATAALSPGNIAAPIRKIFARQRNCTVMLAEARGVDLERRTVILADQPYGYDYLVLAAGVRTNYFGHDDWARLAPGLKTIDEAIDVRRRFLLAFEQAELEEDAAARSAALTFAIVGAGPTGVELAGAVAEISRHTLRQDFRRIDTASMRVILIEAADRVLPTFDPRLSARARRDLEGLGVQLMLDSRVVQVDQAGLVVEARDGAARIAARNVLWAAGVRAVALGPATGAATDRAGRVIVGDDLTVPGHPEVFVVGDLALRADRAGAAVPGVAPAAIQMGGFAGRVIAREIEDLRRGRPRPPRPAFRYRDKGAMATIGRNKAVASIRGWRLGGFVAFALWGLVHILFLIDFRHRLLALAEWIWMYAFYERGVRLITGLGDAAGLRPPTDPRRRT